MRKYALLFPGQGSHKVGMGADFAANSPAARSMFDRADSLLGFSLSKLCFEGPEEELRETINQQPALFVTSCAALEAFRSVVDAQPFAVAGHSVGEYAAIYAAGAIGYEKGLALVRRRAELMQDAARKRPGAMAALLGIDEDGAKKACEGAKDAGIVTVANYNCPGQIVISGEQAAVERAGELSKNLGARVVKMLPVSGGFHSPLMAGAGDALYQDLRDAGFTQAKISVVMNVTADYCKNGVDFAPYLTMQVSSSVRWEQSMRRMIADGVDTFIELGSGDVLTGLMKRIDQESRRQALNDQSSLNIAVQLITV